MATQSELAKKISGIGGHLEKKTLVFKMLQQKFWSGSSSYIKKTETITYKAPHPLKHHVGKYISPLFIFFFPHVTISIPSTHLL